MFKVEVTYDAVNGEPARDGEVMMVVDSLLAYSDVADVAFITASANVVTAFRLAAAQGKVNHADVIFIFEGKKILMDEMFELSDWPKGFCDHQGSFLSEIMQARRALKAQKQE
jgi:predicted ATPase